MVKRTIVAVALAVTLAACGDNPQFARYKDECAARGGYISQSPHWSTVTVSCVGQTRGPQLPAWEGD